MKMLCQVAEGQTKSCSESDVVSNCSLESSTFGQVHTLRQGTRRYNCTWHLTQKQRISPEGFLVILECCELYWDKD